MSEIKNNPEKLEYFYINREGIKIKVFPLFGILDNIFIYCLDLTKGGNITIHRSKLEWENKK